MKKSKPEPAPKPRTTPCAGCGEDTLVDKDHLAAAFNWIKHCWEFRCLPCHAKTLPPEVKKTKGEKGREKFSKLMRSAMRKKPVNRRKGPCPSRGTAA